MPAFSVVITPTDVKALGDNGSISTIALPCSGSGSIGQIATLPSSRRRKRIPEKLALATWAAPMAS